MKGRAMFKRDRIVRRQWTGRLVQMTCVVALLCGLPGIILPVHRSLAAGTTKTAALLTQSTSSSVGGQAVTFQATVQGSGVVNGNMVYPTGTVTFFEQLQPGGSPVVLGSAPLVPNPSAPDAPIATFSTTALALTVRGIVTTAEYFGDTVFSASYSRQLSHTVTSTGKVTMSVVSDFSSILAGVPLQLHATVNPLAPSTRIPTGTVTFTAIDAQGVNHDFGSAPLDANGEATLLLSVDSPNTYTITAGYGGDALYAGARFLAFTQVVQS